MTDGKGDFLSYIVTLTSLQLQTANGTRVETLAAATKVDFAQRLRERRARRYEPGKSRGDQIGGTVIAHSSTTLTVRVGDVVASRR